VRVDNRYHYEINGYFLCDRGRFGHDFVNGEERIRRPLARESRGASLRETSADDALSRATQAVAGRRVIGIGSPRASLEANFALRELVGADSFYLGLSDAEFKSANLSLALLRELPTASLHEIETADAALVLGEDLLTTAPRMALALRQLARRQPTAESIVACPVPEWNDQAVRELVQQQKGSLFSATPGPTKLDEDAAAVYYGELDEIAGLGLAVAAAVDQPSAETDSLATQIATALRNAKRAVIVSGGNEAVMQAAAAVVRALRRAGRDAALCLTQPEGDTLGLAMLGGRALSEVVRDGAECVIVLENDLFARLPEADATAFLERTKTLIVLDHSITRTTARADVVLPAATIAESTGTFVNYEGRAQRCFSAFAPQPDVRESWRWLDALRSSLFWPTFDDVCRAMAQAVPAFAKAPDAAPSAAFRQIGNKIPRQSPRFSGRTAITAQLNVSEPKPPDDPDSPLAFSMEGSREQPPPALIARYWAPGWNSVQALNKFQQEIGGPLRGGDPGVRLIEPEAKP
jgi:NADH-quinone oxidoreductase subunit G